MKKLILTVLMALNILTVGSAEIDDYVVRHNETNEKVAMYDYKQYIGMKYKYGSMDCSMLMIKVLGLTERLNSKSIYQLYKHKYRLVYFKNNHIGLMINDSIILHNTKSRGVNLMNINSIEYKNYWNEKRSL